MSFLPVIHDHDGHIDDLISLAMLATARDRKLLATTLTPADCYLNPSTCAVEKLLTFFGAERVLFGRNDNEGIHPFPPEFRKNSNHLPGLKIFDDVKTVKAKCINNKVAPALLVEVLSKDQKYDVIETGPLTNIAAALMIKPDIAKNINHLYVMGGAIHVRGNVRNQYGHDGTAEWNFYNHPHAAQKAISSGIPTTIISLDITNQLRITPKFVDRLRQQTEFPLSRFAYEAWQIVLQKPDQEYFMWDMLTVAALLQPDLFSFKKEKISIATEGAQCGRSIPTQSGFTVTTPQPKNLQGVEEFFLEFFRR